MSLFLSSPDIHTYIFPCLQHSTKVTILRIVNGSHLAKSSGQFYSQCSSYMPFCHHLTQSLYLGTLYQICMVSQFSCLPSISLAVLSHSHSYFFLLSLLIKIGCTLGLPSFFFFLIHAASCSNCIQFHGLKYYLYAKESRLVYLTMNLKFSLRCLIGI